MKIEGAGLAAKVGANAANAVEEPVMQFKVGTAVVHPVYGVGRIVKIEKKQFPDIKVRRYYQIDLSNRNTIWVPVEAQADIGLRLVTTNKDLDQYRRLLKSQPVILDSNDSKRPVALANRLKEGSFQVMCEIVRDLTASDEGKRLGTTNRSLLLKARESLCQEWAVAANISETEATQEIDSLLQTNRQASTLE